MTINTGSTLGSQSTIPYSQSSDYALNQVLMFDTTLNAFVNTALPTGGTTGEINTGSNLGAGAGVFKDKLGTDLRFKSIVSGSGIAVSSDADEIFIAATNTATGDITGGVNTGTGAHVFRDKDSANLRFRSLTAGTNITLTQNADDIEIVASTNALTLNGIADTGYAKTTNNLSDLTDVAAARTNLGILSTVEYDNRYVKLDTNYLPTLDNTVILGDTTKRFHTIYAREFRGFLVGTATAAQSLEGFDQNDYLEKAGGTMSGDLTLAGAPTSNLHAATKLYVDTAVAGVVDAAPAALDTLNELAAALGDDPNFATTLSTSIGNKVAIDGDTMTGFLTLSGNPTSSLHAATKAYVDNNDALKLTIANNLSDLADVPTARTNLGLGTAALTASTDYLAAGSTTTDIPEGTNLYFTNARADARVTAGIAAATTDDIAEGSTNLYFTNTRADTRADARIAVAELSDLSNVNNAVPSDGQVLTWDNANGYWKPVSLASTANVTVSDNAPVAPLDGDLWWESDIGALRIYYNDGSSSQWVDASPGGSGGGANVTVSDTAPTAPSSGDLWWQSDIGVLQLYYNDGSSSQWVDASPNAMFLASSYYTKTETDARFANVLGTGANLADIQDPAIARTNLGLGTAATADAGDFADTTLSNITNAATARTNIGAIGISDGDGRYVRLDVNYAPTTDNLIVLGDTTQRFNTIYSRVFHGELDGTFSSSMSTDDLAEGSSNLYYTDTRVDARIALQIGASLDLSSKTTDDLAEGLTNLYYTDGRFDTRLATKTTDNLVEGSGNLYYTDTRADARVAIGIANLVDSAPATLDTLNELAAALGDDPNFATTVTNSIATKLAITDFTTTLNTNSIGELSDVDITLVAPTAGQVLAWDSITSQFSPVTIQGYDTSDFNTDFATKTTTDLTEGANLYYTDGRFDTRLASKSTDDVAEGTNLYYTDTRVDTRIGTLSIDALSDVDTVSSLPTANQVLTWDNANSLWVPADAPGAAGGETNDGANVGAGGVGVFDGKVGTTLNFKNIISSNYNLTITDDTVLDNIDIDFSMSPTFENTDTTSVTLKTIPNGSTPVTGTYFTMVNYPTTGNTGYKWTQAHEVDGDLVWSYREINDAGTNTSSSVTFLRMDPNPTGSPTGGPYIAVGSPTIPVVLSNLVYPTADGSANDVLTTNGAGTLSWSAPYTNTDVDTHLNQSNPTAGYVLSWNGTDYAWVDNAGYTNTDVDTHLNQSNPTAGYVLSWDGADYAWVSNGTASEVNDLTSAVTWANVPDVNITQSSVTQHQAALQITESQITDLAHYADSDVDAHLNTSTATANQILSWNGSDYAWVADSGITTFNLAGNTGTGTVDVGGGDSLVVLGTTGQINSSIAANYVSLSLDPNINSIQSIAFEGSTDDANEITLTSDDPAADRTVTLADLSGYVALFDVAPTATITATPAELNYMDGVTSNVQTQLDSKASASSPTFSSAATFNGNAIFNTGVEEAFDTLTGSTGTVTHDCNNGHIFYHTTPSANWTANFTNLGLTAEYATTLTVVINQGATAYIPTAVQIGGVAQTLNWQGGIQPTGTDNGIDVVSFSILNDGGTYVVLGQLVDFT